METIVTLPTDDNWYVVFLAFCQNMVIEAVPYSFLIFVVKNGEEHMLYNFIAGGLYFGLTQIFTPLSCALANWYSFRLLSVLGPCICIVSMLSSHFVSADHHESFFILSFSIVGGFGCSMIHVTSKLMPSYWFCNRRGIAHCVAYSGHAVGFLVITSCTEELFQYVFKKKVAIFFFFTGLFVPLFFLGFLTPKEGGVVVYCASKPSLVNVKSNSRVRFRDAVEAQRVAEDQEHSFSQRASYRIFKTHHNLMYPRVKDLISERDITLYIWNPKMKRVLSRPWQHGVRMWDDEEGLASGSTVVVGNRQVVKMVVHQRPVRMIASRPMYRTDIFFAWNVFDLPIYYRQDNQLDFHLAVTRAMSTRDYMQETSGSLIKCTPLPEAMVRTLITMLGCNIYLDFYMIALEICVFLMALGQLIPLIFIVCRGYETDFADRSFILVVWMGVGQVVGRLMLTCVGILSTSASFYSFNVVLFIIGGLVTTAIGFIDVDVILTVYAIMYGILHGVSQSLRMTAVYEIARLSNLTNAVGHALLWKGMGYITSATLSGYLFVKYKKSWPVFCLSGGAMAVAGVMLIIVRIAKIRALSIVIDV